MDSTRSRVIPTQYLFPFALVTVLFSLWGFANDITNPMVAAFKNILLISNFESSLVQAAFYGGYCFMAIPAALFIKRFSYKHGILMGLTLYGVGCLLFLPAGASKEFGAFLLAFFVMTCGLSFLETTANPYILSMGPEETATRRLNFAQAFNPLGSLTGMFIARELILARLDPADEPARRTLAETDPAAFAAMQQSDLDVIIGPYLVLGLVVVGVMVAFLFARLPNTRGEEEHDLRTMATLRRLLGNGRYVQGVVAQAFYVGVQIMCWTFIIQYAEHELGMPKAQAQSWNIAAMVIFVSSRFICTYLLKFIDPGRLLMLLSLCGAATILGTIFLRGHAGLVCLVATSACMSLMFPTIYGLALKGLGPDAKLGAAGLILAIGGGFFFPPLQGRIMDLNAFDLGFMTMSSARASFVLSLLCFVVIAVYGLRTRARRVAPAAETPGD